MTIDDLSHRYPLTGHLPPPFEAEFPFDGADNIMDEEEVEDVHHAELVEVVPDAPLGFADAAAVQADPQESAAEEVLPEEQNNVSANASSSSLLDNSFLADSLPSSTPPPLPPRPAAPTPCSGANAAGGIANPQITLRAIVNALDAVDLLKICLLRVKYLVEGDILDRDAIAEISQFGNRADQLIACASQGQGPLPGEEKMEIPVDGDGHAQGAAADGSNDAEAGQNEEEQMSG